MYLRLGAAVAALAAGAAGVVVAVTVLRSLPEPASQVSTAAVSPSAAPTPARAVAGGRIPTPDNPGYPSPPPGAVVFAREAGVNALALAVKPGLVRASIVTPAGTGARGLKVSFSLGRSQFVPASSCAPGCYQLQTAGAPSRAVTVEIGTKRYAFTVPKLPAPDATAIVNHATATWNKLRTLVWHEVLGSSPTQALRIVYRAVAPDGLSYTIVGGSAAVIIGSSRWDRPSPGAKWQKSPQEGVRQPQPFWQRVADAHVLGTARDGGRSVWLVSFFDPLTPAWFEAKIDRQTFETIDLRMIAEAHFMHDVYGPFDSPFRLTPPHD